MECIADYWILWTVAKLIWRNEMAEEVARLVFFTDFVMTIFFPFISFYPLAIRKMHVLSELMFFFSTSLRTHRWTAYFEFYSVALSFVCSFFRCSFMNSEKFLFPIVSDRKYLSNCTKRLILWARLSFFFAVLTNAIIAIFYPFSSKSSSGWRNVLVNSVLSSFLAMLNAWQGIKK